MTFQLLSAILVSALAGSYYFILGHCILPVWTFPKMSSSKRTLIGTGLVFGIQMFSSLFCVFLKQPIFYALFITPVIVAALYVRDPFPSIRQSFTDFPLGFFSLYLFCATIMILNAAGYPFIDNVMRIADWTFYFIRAQEFLGGPSELGSYNLLKIPFRRPPFYPLTMATWFSGVGDSLWLFQGLSVFFNAFFFAAIAQIICDHFPKKLRALIFILFFLNATHAYFLTFLWPKHFASFLVLASFFALQELKSNRIFLVVGALTWVCAYCVHQSALFYVPLLLFVLYRETKNLSHMIAWTLLSLFFLVPPMIYQVQRFGWFDGLLGSPTTTQNYTQSAAAYITKWAFAFGSNFLPAYPLYGTFFDDSVPAGWLGKILQFWILFPAHVCDVWYLAADLVGLALVLAWIVKSRKKLRRFPKALAETLHNEPFAALVLVAFISVSMGIGVSPYWQYGANHTVGLIGMTFLGLWILEKCLARLKTDRAQHWVLGFSLFFNAVFVWLILPALQIGFENGDSIFFRTFFWDNADEIAIKPALVYLNDLANHSSIGPMFFGFSIQVFFIFLLLKTSFFPFFQLNKLPFKIGSETLTFARPKKLKLFWIGWVIYSLVTFGLSLHVFDVYPRANRGIMLLPLIGYQLAFWLIALLIHTGRIAGGKLWRSL